MKQFDPKIIGPGVCVCLTAKELDGRSPFQIADFRDMQVASFKPTGHYIGYSNESGIRMCNGPIKLVDGIWVASPDEKAAERFKDVKLSAENLIFMPTPCLYP